jgi:hypothetical protein
MTRETDDAHHAISSTPRIPNKNQAAEDSNGGTRSDQGKIPASNQAPHNQAEDQDSNQVGEIDPVSANHFRWGRILCDSVSSAPEVLIRSVLCCVIEGHINMIPLL